MTSEAQMIAIAEACGWADIRPNPLTNGKRPPYLAGRRNKSDPMLGIPDYLNDYNAIRDALDALGISNGSNLELRIAWMAELHKIVGRRRPKNKVGTPIVSDMDKMFAERKELVEATLRVIGKWKGGAE